ncbi:sulfurtransferase TusA family protein [Acetobacteraceae bacterium KSS8]|uniref:Sulfurtransferase TusA family protein n=1 Tax=Endosaccharibacter trunci TaxID=2812733 RepID=A0ABT1W8H2_9PROT|nr:sulfurtransferase TusA family protein [Acetobacteraceae bacterium KSS8]
MTTAPTAPSDATLDVTGDTCPMTFVRTRLALDRLPPGATLLVRLRGEEPLRNVSASAAALGHQVEAGATGADGVAVLRIIRH